MTDGLTGLEDRRRWDELLMRELEQARRLRKPLCVALLDIDGLKRVNDERGHLAGDKVLQQFGAACRGLLDASDVAARFGGDEFAIAFRGRAIEAAFVIVEHLCIAVRSELGCSAAIASLNSDESADDLVRRVDRALCEAKRTGGNRTVIAS